MSNLRKIPYTKPIPAGAETFTRKGKAFVRWIDGKGKAREAELTEDGRRVRLYTADWWGEYTDADGIAQCVRMARDKTAAAQMLAELVRKAELSKAGIVDPYETHRRRPLTEHLADYEAHLLAKGDTRPHVLKTCACIRAIAAGRGFAFLGDITLSSVQEFLGRLSVDGRVLPPLDAAKAQYTKAELADAFDVKPHCIGPLVHRWKLAAEGQGRRRRFPRETALALRERLRRPLGPSAVNHYIRAVKSFTRWLARDRRLADDPLIGLSAVKTCGDVRRARRPLSPEELQELLSAALGSERTWRGLTGRDRHALYLTAITTGFRAGELAALRPADFGLDAEPPAVVLSGEHAKNGKTAIQPLPPTRRKRFGATCEASRPAHWFGLENGRRAARQCCGSTSTPPASLTASRERTGLNTATSTIFAIPTSPYSTAPAAR